MSGNEERRLIDFTRAGIEKVIWSAPAAALAFRIACRKSRRRRAGGGDYEGRGVSLEESEEKE